MAFLSEEVWVRIQKPNRMGIGRLGLVCVCEYAQNVPLFCAAVGNPVPLCGHESGLRSCQWLDTHTSLQGRKAVYTQVLQILQANAADDPPRFPRSWVRCGCCFCCGVGGMRHVPKRRKGVEDDAMAMFDSSWLRSVSEVRL